MSIMRSLRESNIFHIKTLLSSFNCKLSAISEYHPKKQLLCLVSEDNEIFLRYTNNSGACIMKLVIWFKKSLRVIHDICFDPTGCWLLVLCFDNTLHVVPALQILDSSQIIQNSTFKTTEITSFVIPFVGPHECPSSKTCPNSDSSTPLSTSPVRLAAAVFNLPEQVTGHPISANDVADVQNSSSITESTYGTSGSGSGSDNASSRKSSKNDSGTSCHETNASSTDNVESFLTSSTCPYPICVVWWQTLDKRNRAVIGYSDGSICFVGLTPNCPFIANTLLENGGVVKLHICRDNSMENVTLLINSTTKQQWKLLLEQKCIKYTFPGETSPGASQGSEGSREEWQFVMPIKSNSETSDENITGSDPNMNEENNSAPTTSSQSNSDLNRTQQDNEESSSLKAGLIPAAKARLASLKTLGSKKLNSIKMKLSDNKLKEYMPDGGVNSFTIVDSPTTTPEILTTPAGPFFVVQNLRSTYLLSALHTYSDTLSVHSMDISLIPVFLYKLPKHCQEVLISSNLLYTVQLLNGNEEENKNNIEGAGNPENTTKVEMESVQSTEKVDLEETEKLEPEDKKSNDNEKKMVNAVVVISSAMASIKNGEEKDFNETSLLGTFRFEDETIIGIHRMITFPSVVEPISKEENNDATESTEICSPSHYVRLYKKKSADELYSLKNNEIIRNEFPKINYDPCIVVTNRNVYHIDLEKEPHQIFLSAALAGMWTTCEEFCTTFDLSYQQCIEFAGDCLLKKKKVTQALLTYNAARIPPVRTALKLAMYGEDYALMHLCAMAMKCIYLLKSKHFSKPIINYVVQGAQYRHAENIENQIPKRPGRNEIVNEGKSCSDFNYGTDESTSSLQLSASSQFHLSNLLLITFANRCVRERNYIPLWNFLVINTKFHTNMTSIVLCQSGLYSAALLLAMVRGACIDVYVGMVSVAGQEFGWYSEINVLMYNLSETLFTECITYLRHISTDYFNLVQNKLEKFEENVLQRLEIQLNPFAPVFRPVLCCLSTRTIDPALEENNSELSAFCKILIETYLGVILHLEMMRKKQDNLLNALHSFKLNHEDNQFAIDSSKFSPLSVGCSHNACIIDGCAYFWGSPGVPCIYSVTKASDPPEPSHVVKSLDILTQLNLEVHAVKCGKQHTLILTNNGLYAFGSNQLGQLGIKTRMLCALQPMLIDTFDNKEITILEAGQYHNAVVAEGLLYTWGWGVHGQLGHGDTENVLLPKRVTYFQGKKIKEVSLGHAHSLVLCSVSNGYTELYVFGSNHFGQLGIGQKYLSGKQTTNLVKSLVPLKLEFNDGYIRLIHTKFFSNLAVTNKNKLYTWGSSPQALRLANQVRRRANAKQKIEENLRKEINKRATQNNKLSEDVALLNDFVTVLKTTEKKKEESKEKDDVTAEQNKDNEEAQTNSSTASNSNENTENLIEIKSNQDGETGVECPIIKIEDTDPLGSTSGVEENVHEVKTIPQKKYEPAESEATDHLYPQIVDTSEVSGNIIQISSGLFHFALISSTSLLYTWGKNLEHQLGTEDKERKAVSKPSPLDNVDNPMHVECGLDYTVVMSKNYTVKAFGGNSYGQCGRDLGPPIDKNKPGKLFCLPSTKRLMRLEGQCVENPTEVNLPRPRIRMDTEPTRYLKSIPIYKTQFVQRSGLSLDFDTVKSSSGGNINIESDDLTSNASYNDDDSLNSSIARIRNLSCDYTPEDEMKDRFSPMNVNDFRHYVHYCLYIFHGLYDSEKVLTFAENSHEFRIRILMLNFKFIEAFKLCLVECHTAQKSIKIFEYFTKDTSIVPMRRQDLKFFIYHLFIDFISKKFDLIECERFFLADLDYYLLELAYVLYFNNNNTEMEQNLNRKFRNLFMNDYNETQDHQFEDTDKIFDNLSVKFKAIVCQRLLKLAEN